MNQVAHEGIAESFIREVGQRLAGNKPIKRALPGGGLLSIDRELPFLCVYRRNPGRDDAGTASFANHEAAYLSAPGNAPVREGLNSLIQSIAEQAAARFGAYLILEIRASPDSEVQCVEDPETHEKTMPPPGFRIHAEAEAHCMETINALRFGLRQLRLHREASVVDVQLNSDVHPPGLTPLMSAVQRRSLRCVLIGLEILPVYRDPSSGTPFPDVLRRMRRKVSRAIKKAFYAFAMHQTNLRPHHYYALGRSRIARSVWEIDKQLAAVSGSFDPLLLVTPINAKSCWHGFLASDYQTLPLFRYRPLPFDPFVMKRQLMDIPIERVADPTLSHIFRLTQDELDRQLTMLFDVGTARFVHGSVQVYQGVESELREQAESLLEMIPVSEPDDSMPLLGPVEFAARAEQELQYYRQLDPTFEATIELREDMYSGLMVSGNRLLVGQGTSVPEDRVDALLAHEIGTHLVTRHNGQQQPMQLLQSGLAGYDPLQEGLAVFAEYLVGGLTLARLRLLALRVIAAETMIEGASFHRTFALLSETYAMPPHAAYTVALRVYRGGGLTKDAAYLRGLNQLLGYLRTSSDLDSLYVGKVSTVDLPLIHELRLRNVLRPPALLPRCLAGDRAAGLLDKARCFTTVLDLARDLLP